MRSREFMSFFGTRVAIVGAILVDANCTNANALECKPNNCARFHEFSICSSRLQIGNTKP